MFLVIPFVFGGPVSLLSARRSAREENGERDRLTVLGGIAALSLDAMMQGIFPNPARRSGT